MARVAADRIARCGDARPVSPRFGQRRFARDLNGEVSKKRMERERARQPMMATA